ncbi:hypothetical protein NDU88_007749 [Pleurodeles waltl]|uniref:Uncharacterized protein n=1 Tax=Pleurodeles waltl TaxID=8319 RepID=A0AAV7VRP5_PLEWA|nr:hypothetical protein NDU88_007749 [Pleurodeles waltl]
MAGSPGPLAPMLSQFMAGFSATPSCSHRGWAKGSSRLGAKLDCAERPRHAAKAQRGRTGCSSIQSRQRREPLNVRHCVPKPQGTHNTAPIH